MQGPIVLLAAFTIADLTIGQVLAEDFIKRALENLQRHQNQDLKISVDLDVDKYQEQRDDDDDDDDDSNLRGLKDDNLALLELALKANDMKKRGRIETSKKKQQYQPSHWDMLNGLGANDVLLYDPDSHRPIRTERQKNPILDIMDILGSKHENAAVDVGNDNLPIYVIVNSNDVQKSKSDNSINNLLSSLLNQNDHSSKQDQRYKGFRVMNPYRRARDSNEKYDSDEVEDKRPLSRPRTYGGGGGGRTPIPYIRHRGDIYEKDN